MREGEEMDSVYLWLKGDICLTDNIDPLAIRKANSQLIPHAQLDKSWLRSDQLGTRRDGPDQKWRT